MKKLFAAVMAIAMFFGVTVNADAVTTGGSLTINNTAEKTEATYDVYRILDLKYDAANSSYAYTINAAWANFFAQEDVAELITTQTNQDGITYVTGISDAKTISELAFAYAKDEKNGISPLATETIPAKGSKTLTGLNLGYYLVGSSLGALVNLNTTALNVTVNEKNVEPDVKKEVVEDTTSVGQDIHYTITVTVQKGAENYVAKDTLSAGLTFNNDAVVYVGTSIVDAKNYEVKACAANENCSFKVSFNNDYVSTLNPGTEILVKYTAKVTEDARVLNKVNNKVTLEYGRDNSVSKDPIVTTLYGFSFKKVDEATKAVVNGAEFKLYDKDNKEVGLVLDNGVYRLAKSGETAETIKAGEATVEGIATGKYYLEEVVAPRGYIKLTEKITVDVTENSIDTIVSIVNVESNAVLPTTGGAGTVAFVTIGSLITAICGFVLVTKLRMSRI